MSEKPRSEKQQPKTPWLFLAVGAVIAGLTLERIAAQWAVLVMIGLYLVALGLIVAAISKGALKRGLLMVLSLSFTGAFALMLAGYGAAKLTFWPQYTDYHKCLEASLSEPAQIQCRADFEKAVNDHLKQK